MRDQLRMLSNTKWKAAHLTKQLMCSKIGITETFKASGFERKAIVSGCQKLG